MIKLTTTKEASKDNGIKVLVHAPPGTGKTRLCGTTGCPDETLIISAEAGLLSLRDLDIPVAEVTCLQDVRDLYMALINDKNYAHFKWICIDSITEIGEVVLAAELKDSSDPRQAYGALIKDMGELVRGFRDLKGRNVYMSCKQEQIKDEGSGLLLRGPSMPGSKLGPGLPYLFDEVFALLAYRDPETKVITRTLQTVNDGQYSCKDRSGSLQEFEEPSLEVIARKIMANEKPAEEKKEADPETVVDSQE